MRSEIRQDSKLFRELSRSLLAKGISIRFLVRGRSMFPAIRDGEAVLVEHKDVRKGDVLLVDTEDGLRLHRLQRCVDGKLITQGDCCAEPEMSDGAAVLGRVYKVLGVKGARSPHRFARYFHRLRDFFHP